MKILLLGSTGLLGRNVLNKLLEKKHHVVAVVRNSHGIKDIQSKNLTIIESSLNDISHLKSTAKDCHAVINCAGTTDMSLLHYEDYLAMNTELCRSLISLAETTDIKTIVHISTANTIGFGTPGHPADESNGMREPFASSYYARSKREGEKILEEYAHRHSDCHIVILNPGFMVGAWDAKPSSGQLLLAGYRRWIMVAPPGGKSFVAVNDVADAAISALTEGRNGERYLITGEELTLKDFYHRQASVMGYRQIQIKLPRWLLCIAGTLGDILRNLKLKTQLSTNNISQLAVMEYYTSDKAKKELGFSPTSLDDAIRDFFAWNKEHKKLQK